MGRRQVLACLRCTTCLGLGSEPHSPAKKQEERQSDWEQEEEEGRTDTVQNSSRNFGSFESGIWFISNTDSLFSARRQTSVSQASLEKENARRKHACSRLSLHIQRTVTSFFCFFLFTDILFSSFLFDSSSSQGRRRRVGRAVLAGFLLRTSTTGRM